VKTFCVEFKVKNENGRCKFHWRELGEKYAEIVMFLDGPKVI